jgi:hypothetical protein
MMSVWKFIMTRRLNAKAVARNLLVNYEGHKPLTKCEADRVRLALRLSGVDDATNRLTAGFARLILREVI